MTTTATSTVTEILASEIAATGVRAAFNLMGEDTAPLVTRLIDDHAIQVLTMRQEAGAVMAADSYSWLTDGVGFAILGHGPGFTNGLTAAVTAAKADRRVVVITGENAHVSGFRPEMKGTDQRAVATALGIAYLSIDEPNDAPAVFRSALDLAETRRPVVVAVPVDSVHAHCEVAPPPTPRPRAEMPAIEPSPEDVESVVRLIAEAKRPLVLCGRGGLHARAELIELAERIGALLGTTLLARDTFRGNRLDLGMVGGWASDPGRPLLAEMDLVLAFGASLNSFTMARGRLFTDAPIVQIDLDPGHIGRYYPIAAGVRADTLATAKALLATFPERTNAALHQADVLDRVALPPYLGGDESSEAGIDPYAVAQILDGILPPERRIVTDGGHFMGFPGLYMRGLGPDRFRVTSSFGSIGLGLGAAIGAAVTCPSEPTVLFAGDGGFTMSISDLETVSRYRVPLTIIVMDDGAFGAERHFLDHDGYSHEHAIFGDVDFAGIAGALGIEAHTVSTPDELRRLEPLLDRVRSEPILVRCKIRGDIRGRWLAMP
jgi:thiamine pyrophosphate-dependent acetolactate synthase large subunit-like protein